MNIFELPKRLYNNSEFDESDSSIKEINKIVKNLKTYGIDSFFENHIGVIINGKSSNYKDRLGVYLYKNIANVVLKKELEVNYNGKSEHFPFVTGFNLVDYIDKNKTLTVPVNHGSETSIRAIEYFMKTKCLYISRLCELPNYFGRDYKIINNILYNRYLNYNFTLITTDLMIEEFYEKASDHTINILKEYKQYSY